MPPKARPRGRRARTPPSPPVPAGPTQPDGPVPVGGKEKMLSGAKAGECCHLSAGRMGVFRAVFGLVVSWSNFFFPLVLLDLRRMTFPGPDGVLCVGLVFMCWAFVHGNVVLG